MRLIAFLVDLTEGNIEKVDSEAYDRRMENMDIRYVENYFNQKLQALYGNWFKWSLSSLLKVVLMSTVVSGRHWRIVACWVLLDRVRRIHRWDASIPISHEARSLTFDFVPLCRNIHLFLARVHTAGCHQLLLFLVVRVLRFEVVW